MPDGGTEAPSAPRASSGKSESGRVSKPIELPSDYDSASTGPVPVYYEGESCSAQSSDGYYGDDDDGSGCSGNTYDTGGGGGGGGGDTIITSGDDDDDDDDDDGWDTPSGDDDDDDDDDGWDTPDGDDDDDDDTSTSSYVAPQATKMGVITARAPHHRERSPVSRFALFGVLIAFPLRRAKRLRSSASMLLRHARRRNGSE